MVLTQKETTLLNDIKTQEQLCVDKYTHYSDSAIDPELSQLFTDIANRERQHLDTINTILGGTVPSMNAGGQGQSQNQNSSNCEGKYAPLGNSEDKTHDKYLCDDSLATEKHASSTYNTSIFEFTNDQLRDVLNHLQKEEQEHGKQIYDYMSKNGMYGN